MEIVIGLHRHNSLRMARDWFAAGPTDVVVRQVFDWAAEQEAEWGECVGFIEVDVPGHGRLKAENIDLILAFTDRVIVGEVKSYADLHPAQAALFSALAQCDKKYDLVRLHFAARRALPSDALRALLFFPNLATDEIANLTALQLSRNSARHVLVAGGSRCADLPVLANGHPIYLPAVLQARLPQIVRDPRRVYTTLGTLRDLVGTTHSLSFANAEQAIEYVKREADSHAGIRVLPGHVYGLRGETHSYALARLKAHGFLEVIGGSGMGKSAFVRELLSAMAADTPSSLLIAAGELSSESSVWQVCRRLLSQFDRPSRDFEDDTVLLQRLLDIDGVVWIQAFSPSATEALRTILDHKRSSSHQTRCRFIVESRTAPLVPTRAEDGTYSKHFVWLRALSPQAAKRIVGNAPFLKPGATRTGWPNLAGNPRRDLDSIRGATDAAGDATRLEHHFGWLRHRTALDWEVMEFLVCTLDDCPTGIGIDMLDRIVADVIPGRSVSTLQAALSRILIRLETADRLIYRSESPRGRRSFRRLVGDTASYVTVGLRLPSLADYVRHSVGDSVWAATKLRVLQALGPYSHRPDVAVAIGFKELCLEPYLSSSYRHWRALRADVITWLDRRRIDRRHQSPAEHFFEQFMRFDMWFSAGYQLNMWRPPVDIVPELGPCPTDGDLPGSIQRYVELLIQALRAPVFEPSRVLLEVGPFEADGIAVEVMCRLFGIFAPRSKEVWPMFASALSQTSEYSPRIRMLLYSNALRCIENGGLSFVAECEALTQEMCAEAIAWSLTECDARAVNTFYDTHARIRSRLNMLDLGYLHVSDRLLQ